MKENFNPNRNVSIPYICPRIGDGMAVDPDKGPNNFQREAASIRVWLCEQEDKCPTECPMREITKDREE